MTESSLVSLSGIDPKTAREKREELNLGSIYTALLTQQSDDQDHFTIQGIFFLTHTRFSFILYKTNK